MKEKIKHLFTNYLISTILLFVILFISSLTNCGVKSNFETIIYLFSSSVCHSAIIMLLITLIVSPICLSLKKNKISDIIFAIISTLIQLLAITDYFVFSLYRFHINGFVIGMLTGPAAAQIFVFDTILILKCLLGILVITAINLFSFLKLQYYTIFKTYKKRYPIIIISLLIIIANFMHALGAVQLDSNIIKCTEAIPYYYPIRANRFLSNLGIVDIQKNQSAKVNNGTLKYPKTELNWNNSITPPNIILIMIDAWNRRVFNSETTPNIKKFAEKCTWYSDHVSSSNGTQGSVFTIFTSLSSYYWQDFELNNVSPIFSDRLKALNYDVQTFSGASLRNPPFNRVLLQNFPDITTDTQGNTVYDRDCKLSENFINYLDSTNNSRPFFAWLFYDLAHSYEMPKERLWKFRPTWEFADYTKLSADMNPEPFFNLYQNAVYQADSLVGIVLNKIQEKGLLENSVIIICGDHGQEFNDNHKNFWGHNGNFSDFQIGTNLLWYSPDCQAKTISYRTSHYDLCPTLLKTYLGLRNECSDFGSGKTLSDSTSRDWLLVGSRDNFAFIHQKHIYEKRPSGYFFATDAHLNELPQDSINYNVLNEKILQIGDFYK